MSIFVSVQTSPKAQPRQDHVGVDPPPPWQKETYPSREVTCANWFTHPFVIVLFSGIILLFLTADTVGLSIKINWLDEQIRSYHPSEITHHLPDLYHVIFCRACNNPRFSRVPTEIRNSTHMSTVYKLQLNLTSSLAHTHAHSKYNYQKFRRTILSVLNREFISYSCQIPY